jgi:Rps23 Pro-64 3,4-dihydroxylase Tpa1-like proline 4-hydroxylase
MARMTKAELQYELQRIHDEQTLEIKQQVQAQQEEAEKLARAKTHIQESIEKFEDVSDLGGLTLDQWLKQTSEERKYDESGMLVSIGEFAIVYSTFPSEPSCKEVWGTLCHMSYGKYRDSEIWILSRDGWINSDQVFEGDLDDKSLTYTYIKDELESYEKSLLRD